MNRDDAPRDERAEVEWRDTALPYLEVRLLRPRPIVTMTKAGKVRDTGELSPWLVEVRTGPAGMAPATGSPDRLREQARALLDAADELRGPGRGPAAPRPRPRPVGKSLP